VQVELSHREAKDLFAPFVDEELPKLEALRLRAHLDDCDECRTGWQRYERVVRTTRGLTREKAPVGLVNAIMRRIRRRRFAARALALHQANYRIPVEMILPLLLAAGVAAMLFFAAQT
jgi:anti-sigma factor RsiW